MTTLTTDWGLVSSNTPISAVVIARPATATATTSLSVDDIAAALATQLKSMDLKTTVTFAKKEDALGIKSNPNEEAKVEMVSAHVDVYQAASTFDDLKLKPELYNGVMAMGFVKPSKIQAESLPIMLSPQKPNFIGQAQAGSGKTAAYSLAMLTAVDDSKQLCQAICVCPTRELARQVAEVVEQLGKFTKVKVLQAIRGGERGKVTAQIVVGTPGSLLSKLKYRDIVDKNAIQVLVVDEADQMVDQEGFNTDTVNLKRSINPRAQIFLFSATFPERVVKFAEAVAPGAAWIRVKPDDLTLDNIHQFSMAAPDESAKFNLLADLYSLMDSVKTAKFVAKKMHDLGMTVSLLHGKDMDLKERDRVMDDFRSGAASILISTNVLARGIDVLDVTMVINYDLPLTCDNTPDFETYLHRIGRTGRFGKSGVAINFVYDDVSKRQLAAIASFYKKAIVELPIGAGTLEAVRKIVKEALAKPPTVSR